MAKYAIPCMISLLVAALYNIVDQIFIANAPYLGSAGNAANTVVFPLTIVALALAVMIGDGCCAFVSISLGGGEKRKAAMSVGNSIVLVVSASLILMVVYLIFSDSLIGLFGGNVNEETHRYAKEYFFTITLGLPFYMFGQAMNPIIRSDGSPRFAMVTTGLGAIINIILDPVMIFVLKWGMMGAALATVIGQIVTALFALAYLFGMKNIHLTRKDFILHRTTVGAVLPLGLCSFLSQISLVAAMAAINNMIHHYGAQDPIFSQESYAQIPLAVIGIVMKFFQIVISLVVGMAAGCIPIVGYNIGSGRRDRAKSLFLHLLFFQAVIGLIALVIVECFPRQLIAVFGAANESAYYTAFAIRSFRIYLSMMIFACINKASFIFLQSLGKPWISTFLSLLREVVFGVGFALLLPTFSGLDGVLYSMPVSDALTFIASLVVIICTYRELSVSSEKVKEERDEEEKELSPVFKGNGVICIGRSFGSRGRSIGRKVAEILSIPYYDKEILALASEKSGLDASCLAIRDERKMQAGYNKGENNTLCDKAKMAEREAIIALADKGPCVIVGRRADQILRSTHALCSVFITDSEDDRASRVSRRESIDAKTALNKLHAVDKERAAFYNQLSEKSWGQASNYDLCLDSGSFGIEGCASLVVASAQALFTR